jgi:endonuclease/exonuclease/phosphatase family metal-dependent hydrolase
MRLRASVMAAAMGLGVSACSHLPVKAPDPIRVMVLNMHAGKDAAGNSNLDAIASLITNTGADLVLLQDVDSSTLGTLGTKLHYSSAGGDYGVAALARGFIGFSTTYPLTITPAAASGDAAPTRRVALAIVASLRTGEFGAINTQFDPAEGRVGDQNVARLANAIGSQKAAGTPLAVGGSFNATPDHPGFARLKALGLRDAWTECGSGDGFTYPSDKPAKRIDYLFLAGDLHCSGATVLDTQISDHRPLLVTLK